ncbi:MAG TPA: 50S ribosomal protein L4, partial [Thermoleophilaceae bacterium]|nr:50S ribosomal protein L4 [Thermoleophilaceae bacterium]
VKVNRKARRRALRAALSAHAGRGSLAVVDPGEFQPPSTKRAAAAIGEGRGERTLVVLSLAPDGREGGEDACAKSFRNLPEATVMAVDAVGVADVMAARRLIASPSALERLTRIAAAPGRDRGAGAGPDAGAANESTAGEATAADESKAGEATA